MPEQTMSADQTSDEPKRRLGFPSAVTTLVIVTLLVWVAALFIPPGRYAQDADGSPIPGTYQRIESPLSTGAKVCDRFAVATPAGHDRHGGSRAGGDLSWRSRQHLLFEPAR